MSAAPSPEGVAIGLILLIAAGIGVRRFLDYRARMRRFRDYARDSRRSTERAGSLASFERQVRR